VTNDFDDVRAAEHWIHQSGRPAAYTYFADNRVHVAFEDPPEGARAVVFPGVDALTGVLTIQAVLDSSAIEHLRVLGGGEPDPATELDTRDFVRPLWSDGALTLVAQPAAGGRLIPFESPNPTPCCADHA
jgi:hypothetical protein